MSAGGAVSSRGGGGSRRRVLGGVSARGGRSSPGASRGWAGCVLSLTAGVSHRPDPLVARGRGARRGRLGLVARRRLLPRRLDRRGLFGPEGLVGLDVRWADGVLEGLGRQRATRAAGSAFGRGASAVL